MNIYVLCASIHTYIYMYLYIHIYMYRYTCIYNNGSRLTEKYNKIICIFYDKSYV